MPLKIVPKKTGPKKFTSKSVKKKPPSKNGKKVPLFAEGGPKRFSRKKRR